MARAARQGDRILERICARASNRATAAQARKSDHFTHFDAAGQAHMVDVAGKDVTRRVARAGGRIVMQPATFALIRAGSARKGDVLGVARIAAIQAAKRTSELIPLCHPLPLTRVAVDFAARRSGEARWRSRCTAETLGRTGVEMEALTAATVGLAHDLRHVQGCRPRDANRGCPPAREIGRQVGKFPRALTITGRCQCVQQRHQGPRSMATSCEPRPALQSSGPVVGPVDRRRCRRYSRRSRSAGCAIPPGAAPRGQ